MASRNVVAWLLLLATLLPTGCLDDSSEPAEDLPAFTGSPYSIGALICVSGATAGNAPDLERAVILAAEFVNGSSRAFPDSAPDQIPCRLNGTCGVRVGRDADGMVLRGKLEVVVANTEDRPDRAVAAGRRLVEQESVRVLLGPCSAETMNELFAQVTGTESLLITPVVTADAISDLPDRTEAEIEAGEPGWVFRTVVPDYLLTQTLGIAAQNALQPPPFIHGTDQTSRECQDTAECGDLGPDFRCLTSIEDAEPEREFLPPLDVACAGPQDTSCDLFGANFQCRAQAAGFRCQQFRSRQFCTRVPASKTALILYPETADGERLRARLNTFWTEREQLSVIAETGYNPAEPSSYPSRLREMFRDAERNFSALRTQGVLESDYPFEDSVVFLFADATDGGLFLQEWSALGDSLQIEGADNVFWAGLNPLRSALLTNQLPYQALRNLHVIDPAALDVNSGASFEKLFERRWGEAPSEFSGNIFDAALLVALALERAGVELQGPGAVGPPSPAAIKSALPRVATGCNLTVLDEDCEDVLGFSPDAVPFEDYADAVQAIAAGQDLQLIGSTGDLSFSPAGDRSGTVQLYKVERDGERGRFFFLDSLTPETFGINLEQ